MRGQETEFEPRSTVEHDPCGDRSIRPMHGLADYR